MGRQFDTVNGKRGAPMGRSRYGKVGLAKNVRLFKVSLDSGGYDDGGAYWGFSYHGDLLWCAVSQGTAETTGPQPRDYRDFVRANTRKEARDKLGLDNSQLIRKER